LRGHGFTKLFDVSTKHFQCVEVKGVAVRKKLGSPRLSTARVLLEDSEELRRDGLWRHFVRKRKQVPYGCFQDVDVQNVMSPFEQALT